MRLLVAIVSCHKREEWADAIRSTWAPMAPEGMDVRFFRGRGATRVAGPDEVFLDCGDEYDDLPDKIRAIVRWAYENGYDHMLKCDDDVVLDPVELWKSGFENHEYSGKSNRPMLPGRPWCVPYGFCYLFSKRCMEAIKDAALPSSGNDDEKWVAEILFNSGVRLHNVPRYFLYIGEIIDKRQTYQKVGLFRPLNLIPVRYQEQENNLAWCIHLTSAGDVSVKLETKIAAFHKIFGEKVANKERNVLA